MVVFAQQIAVVLLIVYMLVSSLIASEMGPLEIKKNKTVEYFVDYYKTRGKKTLEVSLERYRYFRKIVESVIEEEGLPKEIAYIPIVESNYNGNAISKHRAVGFWQFKYGTAVLFGIEKNQYIDERQDIEKSTRAACKYLKFLYKELGDWDLVIAAYNMGRINLENVIRKTKTRNFWELVAKGYIRKETKEFVAKFYAITTIINRGEVKLGEPIDIEKIELPGGIRLSEVSKITGMSYEEVKMLNPHIKKDIIPPSGANIYLQKDKAFLVKIFLELRA